MVKRKNTSPKSNESKRETRSTTRNMSEPLVSNLDVGSPVENFFYTMENAPQDTTGFDVELHKAMKATSISSKAKSRASSSAFSEANTFGGVRTGKMRDIIEIDILTIDDKPYKETLTEKAIYNEIYRGVYKLPKEKIHGIRSAWRGHPFVTIKLSEKIDIDKLPAKFTYFRCYETENGDTIDYIIKGETRGVRTSDPQKGSVQKDAPVKKKWIRWVKIDQDGYDMKEEMLKSWLTNYGQLLTEIREENVVVSDVEEESDNEAGAGKVQIGLSSLIVKMELTKHIPEFLPIDGKKVRIHYGGIAKQCLNCYEWNHRKAECKQGKKIWVDYVAEFIKNHDYDPLMYGRWMKIIRERSREMRYEKNTREIVVSSDNEDDTERCRSAVTDIVHRLNAIREKANEKPNVSHQPTTLTEKPNEKSNDNPPPTNENKRRGRPLK